MSVLVFALLAQGDPRLVAKVDLRLKIAPLDEAVVALGKAAGVTLTTAAAVRDMKITILVDGTATGRVMSRIADVMRLQWERQGDGYRLANDPAAASREAAFLSLQTEARRKAMEGKLREQAEAAAIPFLNIPEAYAEAQRAVQTLKPGEPKRDEAMGRMNALSGMMLRENWLQGQFLRRLGPAGWKRLLSGEPMAASTAPGTGGVALPVAALNYPQWQGPNGEGDERTRLGRIDLFVRADPETGELSFRSDQVGADGNSRGTSSGSNGFGFGNDPATFETHFWKESMAWGQQKTDDPALALRCDPKTPERPSVWWTGYYSESDRLEWLHESSGIPIVAMATRQPTRRSSLRFDGTVGDWLKDARKGYSGTTYRLADGFLMTRPYEFWNRRRQEPPEAVLRRLEAKEPPTIDDYAEFAARITNRQARLVTSTYGFLTRVSPYALSDGLPALRVWATLAPAQRAALRGGGAVPYRALSAAGRAAFGVATGDVFGGGWLEGPMAARFTGNAPVSFGDWGIIGQARDVSAVGRGRPEPLDRDYSKPYAYQQEPNAPGIRLLFGPSREDAVSYTLPLLGLPKQR